VSAPIKNKHYIFNPLIVRKLWGVVGQNTPIVNVRMLQWPNNIVTAFPEHVKMILATNPDNYVKGERCEAFNSFKLVSLNTVVLTGDDFREATSSTLGTGVFTTDGTCSSCVLPITSLQNTRAYMEVSFPFIKPSTRPSKNAMECQIPPIRSSPSFPP
jgi:hypothetical protein